MADTKGKVNKAILTCVEHDIYGTGMFFVVNIASGNPLTHDEIIAKIEDTLSNCKCRGNECGPLIKALVDMQQSKVLFKAKLA